MVNTELLSVAKKLHKQASELAEGLMYLDQLGTDRRAVLGELLPYAELVIAAAEKAQPDTSIHQMD